MPLPNSVYSRECCGKALSADLHLVVRPRSRLRHNRENSQAPLPSGIQQGTLATARRPVLMKTIARETMITA
ncbi:hypothetical protein PILCRDRAFT_251537 [Piloderma croceum F 1598]|uniref:Uncharacterized protein n=1 Tax=Piloderma croceum (strain F 1598) TaxID=765440 RepID=A0A0C3G912_PILCF|nr:hypothetical protein PILCRDRAFT_251537 [Piloderma croceum F 1598]